MVVLCVLFDCKSTVQYVQVNDEYCLGQLSVYSDHLVKQVVATPVELSHTCNRLLYMEAYCDPSSSLPPVLRVCDWYVTHNDLQQQDADTGVGKRK